MKSFLRAMFSMRMRRRCLSFFIIISIYVDEEHNMKEEHNENKNKEYKIIHAVLRERKQEDRKVFPLYSA